jgi:three-Cys-motif partner protein
MGERKRDGGGREHSFGGDWTDVKLQILGEYLRSYTTALKNQRFKTAYIDAFAGTGYRSRGEGDERESLFPDVDDAPPDTLLDGSAQIALKTVPRFGRYIFIERNHDRFQQLLRLRQDFPALAGDIEIREDEANAFVQRLCQKNWEKHRAVLFLDPYGMQVEWATIEAVAATQAIDLWLLFPLGVAVNRLLTRDGRIPDGWRRRLDLLLGTTDWADEFYRVESVSTLFGEAELRVKTATTETIGHYFNARLKGIFAGVAAEPKVLFNSSQCPLYLLCFASGNPKGAPIALKIADHLLKRIG